MPMTIVVTRDVVSRFRGFLASCMLEISPGVYTSPRMTKAVRERVWSVLEKWYQDIGGGGITMTWWDNSLPGGQGVVTLGAPHKDLVKTYGVFLARAELTDEKRNSLDL